MQLHDNMHLFGAHKYYVWLFEEALRKECNYTGYQPVSQVSNFTLFLPANTNPLMIDNYKTSLLTERAI
jgi:tyrosinase